MNHSFDDYAKRKRINESVLPDELRAEGVVRPEQVEELAEGDPLDDGGDVPVAAPLDGLELDRALPVQVRGEEAEPGPGGGGGGGGRPVLPTASGNRKVLGSAWERKYTVRPFVSSTAFPQSRNSILACYPHKETLSRVHNNAVP